MTNVITKHQRAHTSLQNTNNYGSAHQPNTCEDLMQLERRGQHSDSCAYSGTSKTKYLSRDIHRSLGLYIVLTNEYAFCSDVLCSLQFGTFFLVLHNV